MVDTVYLDEASSPDDTDITFTAGLGADVNLVTQNAADPGDIHITTGHGLADEAGGDIGITCGNGPLNSRGGHITLASGSSNVSDPNYGEGGNIQFFLGTGTGGGPNGYFKMLLPEFANDVAAAAGGLPISGWYHTAGVVKVRVA